MTDIITVPLSTISEKLLSELKAAFPGPRIEVGFDRDQAIWDQAQAEVVEWVVQKTHTKILTSDITKHR